MNKVRFSTHNIANGGDCSKFGHCSPLRAFVSGDRNALRNPPLRQAPKRYQQAYWTTQQQQNK